MTDTTHDIRPAAPTSASPAPNPSEGRRRKVYVDGPDGIRVPFVEVALSPTPGGAGGDSAVRLYDTSGPGSVPTEGLAPLRRPWVLAAGRRRGVRGPAGHPTRRRARRGSAW